VRRAVRTTTVADRQSMYRPAGKGYQWGFPVDFTAWRTHFLDHLAPIYLALPEDWRGRFWVRSDPTVKSAPSLDQMCERALQWGIDPSPCARVPLGMGPLACSAYSDLEVASRRRRPLILMEHGCGLSFPEHVPGYAGGRGWRGRVGLFLAPNELTAAKTRATYPTAPQLIISTPKLDEWWAKPKRKTRRKKPVVAISFHWRGERVCPEAGTALDHYKDDLSLLTEEFTVLGHGHPKIARELVKVYERAGIEWVPEFDDVLKRADVYLNDASSTLYEFASLDRPVVVLNAPWFRRTVDYGLRFWLYSDIGPQVEEPSQLVDAVWEAWEDPPEYKDRRRAATDALYPIHDGTAAQQAADGIVEFCRTRAAEAPPMRRRGWRTVT